MHMEDQKGGRHGKAYHLTLRYQIARVLLHRDERHGKGELQDVRTGESAPESHLKHWMAREGRDWRTF